MFARTISAPSASSSSTRDALHRAARADRHERRRLDVAVREPQPSRRAPPVAMRHDVERERGRSRRLAYNELPRFGRDSGDVALTA